MEYVRRNGSTFEGRQTKWAHEKFTEKDEAAHRVHDLAGRALEVGSTCDHLDITNSAMAGVMGRMYSLVEETSGSMLMEGVEYFVGRDAAAGSTGLAPVLRKHQSDKLGRDGNVAKNQKKARKELKELSCNNDKTNPKGGGRGGAGKGQG